jgi:hypothetical protein
MVANFSTITIVNNFYPEFIALFVMFSSFFLLIGTLDRKRFNLKTTLVCNIVGIFFCLSLFLSLTGQLGLIIYALLGSFSACLCLPNLIASFLENTNFNNRGSTSGILIFITYILIFFLSAFINSFYIFVTILLAIKALSILVSLKVTFKANESDAPFFAKQKNIIKLSFLSLWLIFILADAFSGFLIAQAPNSNAQIATNINIESYLFGLVSMIIGGALMDNFGRRRIMLFAFTYLGLSYGLISLTAFSFIQLAALDGIAWGILTVLFLMVLWGDACPFSNRPLWIAFSLIVTLFSQIFSTVFKAISPNLIGTSVVQLFPITSILLFLGVGIILYLPETLPDKILKKKELDDYIVQAKKVRQKYTK